MSAASIRARLRRPSVALAVLAFYCLLLALSPPGFQGNWAFWVSSYGTLFLVLSAMAWLAPEPWLWAPGRAECPGFLRGLAQSVLACEAAMLLLVLLDTWVRQAGGLPVDLKGAMQYNLLLYAPLGVILGAMLAGRERQAKAEAAARAELQEAQALLLRNQLHPHVLFNALNGLAELVRKDPGAAEGCIGSLSALMRQLVDASERHAVTLEEERRLVADYLAVETMRLGSRLQVAWELDEGLLGLQLHPLILQPLVENAIKHGISRSAEGGGLVVAARRSGEGVDLEVRNEGAPLSLHREGTGLTNLRRRLELAYGPAARFTLRTEKGWTVARVALGFEALK